MSITQRKFGVLKDGREVTEYFLTNQKGASVGVLDFGATLTNICVPDRDGNLGDVNLGYDDPNDYITKGSCLGALIGRVGNRIGGARFTLEGQEYVLAKNNGENNLHGGVEGFHLRMWQATPSQRGNADALVLKLVSPDGDQGFPGKLDVTVTYTFDDEDALGIEYLATTDKVTICNLTQHAYFNLNGHGAGTVEDLECQVFADHVTETDNALIPTGRLLPTNELNYGFTKTMPLGQALSLNDPVIQNAGGVDFNYCMGRDRETKICAELYSPKTGRVMIVETDQPGVQVYTGQGLNQTGKGGAHYGRYAGVCFETQHYPDAIHHPEFHSVVLRPQDTYFTVTTYRFGVR